MALNDDFFGLDSLEEKPFPERFRQKDQSSIRTIQERSNKEKDLFESEFFPGLDGDAVGEKGRQEQQGSFFDEHFFTSIENSASINVEEAIDSQMDASTIDGSGNAADEGFELNYLPKSGIKQLWSLVDPVWKFTKDELVDYMARRVVYETEDFIALDKPYQMSCASAPNDQAQLDRILMLLKKQITPNIDRLYMVNSLDKSCSGIVLLAKKKGKAEELKKLLTEDQFLFRYRCLCKNIPSAEKSRVSIPLIKVMNKSNVKFCPLIGTASAKHELYHVSTDCKMINKVQRGHISLIDAFSRRSMAQLIRSHLYYGLNCPIVGDPKYQKSHRKQENVLPNKISPYAMDALGLRRNDIRKLPMFMHLSEVHVPMRNQGNFTMIRSELPPFFSYALKKLSLLRK